MDHRGRSALAAALASLFLVLPWMARAGPSVEKVGAHAVAALDGDTFLLADGREVRLAGVAAARSVTAAAIENPPPIVSEATRALERLVAGREVELELSSIRFDRYRRLLAQVYVPIAGTGPPGRHWVQGRLLTEGMARVATTVDTRRLSGEMLALEGEARRAGRGLWALDYYRLLTPQQAAGRIGGFQVVEGEVLAVARVGSRVFLNFGEDWRTDFTVSLDAQARSLARAAGLDLESLQGRTVRVRGWVQSYNGPMIEATHPEQIEVLHE